MPPKKRGDEWHFKRASLARGYLETLEVGCIRRLAICATPSTGKTNFIVNDIIPDARRHGHLVAYVNFREDGRQPAHIVLSAIKSCIESATAENHKIRAICAKIAKHLEFESISIDAHVADIEIKKKKPVEQAADPMQLLRAALKTMAKEFPDHRLLIILDDTQHLAKDPRGGHSDFTSSFAHALDQSSGHVMAIFCITSSHVMDRHFADAGRDLFVRAEITDLPKLDHDFIQFLAAKCQTKIGKSFDADEAWAVFKEIDCAPMVMRSLVARYMWEKGARSIIDIYQEYIEQHPSQRTHRHLWEQLPLLDREVFLAIAAGQNPFSTHVNDNFRKQLGTITPADIRRAAHSLEQSGHIESQPDPQAPYCVISTTFAQWCKTARKDYHLRNGEMMTAALPTRASLAC